MESDKNKNEVIKNENVEENDNEEFYDALETATNDKVKNETEIKDISNDLEKNTESEVKKENSHNNLNNDDDDLKFDDEEDDNEEYRNIMKRRFDFSNDDDDEAKFKPLHEKFNEALKLENESNIAENSNVKTEDSLNPDSENDKKEEDKEKEILPDEQIDPWEVNEELLKTEEAELTIDQLAERHNESIKLKEAGNAFFKEANYNSAIETYTKALKLCPLIETKDRAILYSNRSVCFLKLLQTERCIADCTRSIKLDPKYTKPLLRRAECYENTEKLDDALADYKKLFELEPRNYSHKSKCYQLEQAINERNEKLKTEMFGKLKDLGNMILKPFGLSTNNFQIAQDPNSGSYSINFKQN